MAKILDKAFFAQDTLTVAQKLLGVKMTYRECEGIIVETEAYKTDAASHAVTRPVKGTMLKETFGQIYIFFVYGMYHCLNFTTEKNGVGAVLIRAVEPLAGVEKMKNRRNTESVFNLTNGPGKLFQAFGFDPDIHGQVIGDSVLLEAPENTPNVQIGSSRRIGISKAIELEWRFFVAGNKFISR